MDKLLDFEKGNGLIPVIIQEGKTRQVCMLGYMNEEAFKKTVESGYVYFFSRRQKKLWMKGEESGNKLQIRKITRDCDGDTLLIQVKLVGKSVCHTGNKSCFYTTLGGKL